MEMSRRDLIASVTAGIALSTASAASTKGVPSPYPGPASIGHRFVDASGPLVLLCHGFPESWYSWRHQIPALAAAGYHTVAPDMRGYGGTDAPPEHDSYTIMDLVGDMVCLPRPSNMERPSGLRRPSCRKCCRAPTALIDLGVGSGCLANYLWSSPPTREKLHAVPRTCTRDVDGRALLRVSRMTA
jgi:alpha-beta hydrolase superfamily lysophospholipase